MKKITALFVIGLLVASSIATILLAPQVKKGATSHHDMEPLPPPLSSGNTFMISRDVLENYSLHHPFPPETSYIDGAAFGLDEYQYLKNITKAFNLTPEQLKLLDQNGFIVIDGKDASFINFNRAYKQYWETDLPIFITTDSILNVFHLLLEDVLKNYETLMIGPAMENMVSALYNDSVLMDIGSEKNIEPFREVEVYFAVALSLFRPGISIDSQIKSKVETYLTKINDASLVEDFPGQDYTQYKPRGHYTETPYLQKYFKSMMWIERKLLNMSSPQDVVQAWAITHLMDSDKAALDDWSTVYNITRMLIGTSDSMDRSELESALVKLFGSSDTGRISDANVQLLIQEIDKGEYYRSRICSFVILDVNYDQVSFPKLWSLMGQRYVVDADIMDNLIYDRIPIYNDLCRGLASPLDVMAALGSPRAFEILGPVMQKYGYEQQLKEERAKVQLFSEDFWNQTVYNKLLESYQPLVVQDTGIPPQKFMQTREWASEKLNTALGSYAELKYDTILYTKQTYSNTMCSFPEAYVEPYPVFYQTISIICDMMLNLTKRYPIWTLRESGFSARGPYYNSTFADLKETCQMLAEISLAEISGKDLTTEQADFIKMVYSGDKICASGEGPHYQGWLPRLLWQLTKDEKDLETSVVADICTDPNPPGQVKEIATGYVDTLLVLIDKPDGTRFSAAGPVYSYYEFSSGIGDRLTVDEWRTMLEKKAPERPGWAEGFLA